MKLKFFDLAKRLSVFSDNEKHKLGCCIVRKNRVIGLGFNKMKTSPHASHPFKHWHAEEIALHNASYFTDKIAGSTLYIYRENKNKQPANSFPCKYCLDTIKRVGIKKVCYTGNGQYLECWI